MSGSHPTRSVGLAVGGSLVVVVTALAAGPAAAIWHPEPRQAVTEIEAPVVDRPCFRTPHSWSDTDVGAAPRCR